MKNKNINISENINYESDYNRLNKINALEITNSDISDKYILASRIIEKGSFGSINMTEYNIRGIKSNGTFYPDRIFGAISNNSNSSLGNAPAYGFRPVLTLSPNVKITGGEGTEDSPFEIGL